MITRRGFFGLLPLVAAAPAEHTHKWQKSPLCISVMTLLDSDNVPHGFAPLQLCSCGLMRVGDTKGLLGVYVDEGPFTA